MFNNATQVVLMRQGTRTVLSMQNELSGAAGGLRDGRAGAGRAQGGDVKTLTKEVFDRKVDAMGSPRLVEYWEQDPCPADRGLWTVDADAAQESAGECTGRSAGAKGTGGYGVKIEAQFAVGEYQIVILSAKDSTGLDRYLRDQNYKIPAGAEPLLRPYVEGGSKFFVAKVDPKKVKFDKGMAQLSPLRFHYDSEEFSLPIRLGLANARQAGPDRQHPRAGAALRARELQERHDPDEPRRQGRGAHAVRRVLRRAVRSHRAAEPRRGDHRVRVGCEHLRSLSGAAARRRRLRDARCGCAGARADTHNNFQARYAIRHAWTGPIACANPRRNVWGGPPPQETRPNQTVAATGIAFAPRTGIALSELVKRDVPEIALTAAGASQGLLPQLPVEPPPVPTGSGSTARTEEPRGGCGCQTNGVDGGLVAGLAGLALFARRRRREQAESFFRR
jgi:MYXO-CTERM domain-containing protein